jgi:hypothetical protein
MKRSVTLIFGIILAAGAFVGLLLLGSMMNPSPYPVVVVVKDIEAGEVLQEHMVGVDPQQVSPQVVEQYVLSSQLEQYLGKVVTRRLYPGQPLMHYDVVAEGNVMAQRRLALVLEDPNKVAMVIPVEETSIPDAVMAGDFVAIVWSVGEGNMLERSAAYAGESGVTSGSAPPGFVVGPDGSLLPVGSVDEEEEALSSVPTLEPLPSVEVPPTRVPSDRSGDSEPIGGGVLPTQQAGAPEVALPLAKKIVNAAVVIGVRREQQPNPSYTGEPGEEPYLDGKIIGLELAVPIDEVEAVRFAIANGDYSIVILSPNADMSVMEQAASLGVMWTDVQAFIAADRMRALGMYTPTEPIRPAGAAEIHKEALEPKPAEETPQATVVIPPSGGDRPRATATGDEEEATATPGASGALPTATPRSRAADEDEETETPEPTVGALENVVGGESGGGQLGVSLDSIVLGAGCIVCIAGVVVLVIVVVRRRAKKTG